MKNYGKITLKKKCMHQCCSSCTENCFNLKSRLDKLYRQFNELTTEVAQERNRDAAKQKNRSQHLEKKKKAKAKKSSSQRKLSKRTR